MESKVSKEPLRITDLPPEILYNIFPYLSVRNFVNLTNCTRAFFPYRQDSGFWSSLVRKSFRLPPQPLLEGKRWQWLYKKLSKQTKIYTWGDNKSGNLGHVNPLPPSHQHLTPYSHLEPSGWPKQPFVQIYMGILSDIQCGGWCTTILDNHGNLYIMGHLSDSSSRSRSVHGHHLRSLHFPPGYYMTSHCTYWPDTAIKQFSTGRSAVLGLSDTEIVWQWKGNDTAVIVNSLNVDLKAHKVLEVQAGWDRCSVLVQGVGIVYWAQNRESDLVPGGVQENLSTGSTLVVDTVTIPGTAYRRDSHQVPPEDSLDAQIGEIKQFIVLEAHCVFITHGNRIFSYATVFPPPGSDYPDPVELTAFYPQTKVSTTEPPIEIKAITGSFRNFAVFTSANEILTATRDHLDAVHQRASYPEAKNQVPPPSRLPLLQTGDIISLSFGDHHLHALHADGTISSLGTDCQSCGSLGLGGAQEAPYRGVLKPEGRGWNDTHLPKDGKRRRTIWFEPLMKYWLEVLVWHSRDLDERAEDGGRDKIQDIGYRERIGDWFEEQGRKFMALRYLDSEAGSGDHDKGKDQEQEERVENNDVDDDDDMPPYFAYKIASAGWHSAALVLVDEAKAAKIHERYWIPPPPPPPNPPKTIAGTLWSAGRRFLGLKDERAEGEGKGRYSFDGDVLPDL